MKLTARETKENRNDFLKEIKLCIFPDYHHSLTHCRSLRQGLLDLPLRSMLAFFDLSLKNFGKMDGNAAEYNIVDETCASF